MKPSTINQKLKTRFSQSGQSSRTGAMLPMVAVVIVILFIAVSFAVDIARMHLTRSELRTATDAAARAAVESLGRVQNTQGATDAALAVAKRNIVAGSGLNLDANKIVFGNSTQGSDGKFSFTESSTTINSVRVFGERTQDSPDGPVALMFGPMLGTGTFSPVASSTAVRLDRDIALVLDKSGSMGSNGRFAALKNGLDVFLNEMDRSIPEERVSLTVYDTQPTKLVDMTDNLVSIRDSFATQTPNGFTGIGRALQVGLDSIQNDAGSRGPFSLKSVVLMTDGNQNRGINPTAVAQEAKRLGIIVHTITFSSGANETLMKNVANTTGGIHVHANTDQELLDAFNEIANTIQVLTIE
ncbi:vWA domain-containing protein [Mariniblastus fucicola]|nr:VWA domain-containing protein [Mariniblastus fucicola]